MDNLPSLRPVFCVIAQGSKEVFLNNERYVYDPSHYLLVTAELSLVVSVMVEAGDIAPKKHTDVKAVNVNSMNCASAQRFLKGFLRVLPWHCPSATRTSVWGNWSASLHSGPS